MHTFPTGTYYRMYIHMHIAGVPLFGMGFGGMGAEHAATLEVSPEERHSAVSVLFIYCLCVVYV